MCISICCLRGDFFTVSTMLLMLYWVNLQALAKHLMHITRKAMIRLFFLHARSFYFCAFKRALKPQWFKNQSKCLILQHIFKFILYCLTVDFTLKFFFSKSRKIRNLNSNETFWWIFKHYVRTFCSFFHLANLLKSYKREKRPL